MRTERSIVSDPVRAAVKMLRGAGAGKFEQLVGDQRVPTRTYLKELMATETKLTGPDLSAGVDANTLQPGDTLLGHARGEAILLARVGDEFVAIGASCTVDRRLTCTNPSTTTGPTASTTNAANR